VWPDRPMVGQSATSHIRSILTFIVLVISWNVLRLEVVELSTRARN
jgi:hypothetical protein